MDGAKETDSMVGISERRYFACWAMYHGRECRPSRRSHPVQARVGRTEGSIRSVEVLTSPALPGLLLAATSTYMYSRLTYAHWAASRTKRHRKNRTALPRHISGPVWLITRWKRGAEHPRNGPRVRQPPHQTFDVPNKTFRDILVTVGWKFVNVPLF